MSLENGILRFFNGLDGGRDNAEIVEYAIKYC